MKTDWQGKEIPADEPDDAVIDVWEVSPHLTDDHFDCYVERSWQDMTDGVENGLAMFLEWFDEEQLREGVTITFKLKAMSKQEYEEIVANTE